MARADDSPCEIDRLRKREDFVALRDGDRVRTRGFTLQWRRRDGQPEARVGFTVTRKEGGAVVRNRIRRRLREAVRLTAACSALAGCDYVLIGRQASLGLAFAVLLQDVDAAFRRARETALDPRGPFKANRRPDGSDRAAGRSRRGAGDARASRPAAEGPDG